MIQVISLGLNNLGSLVRALDEVSDKEVTLVHSAEDLRSGKLVLIPGTGAFGEGMRRMHKRNLPLALKSWVDRGTGILAGVCLGMQLLAESSEESPGVRGLSLIRGEVAHLKHLSTREDRVPHVGWAEVSRTCSSSSGWSSINDRSDYYFSHSFHLVPRPWSEFDVLRTPFGAEHFVSGIRKENIVGYQFHPEKSSTEGLDLLRGLVEESNNIA